MSDFHLKLYPAFALFNNHADSSTTTNYAPRLGNYDRAYPEEHELRDEDPDRG